MSKGSPNDLLSLAERFVAPAEQGDDEWCELPVWLARALIELAKTAKRPRGRQPIPGRMQVREGMVLFRARRRKAELIAAGMAKEAAHEKAAEEAATALRSRNLAVSTIKRRMERRRRHRLQRRD